MNAPTNATSLGPLSAASSQDQALADLLAEGFDCLGQVAIVAGASGGYLLRHRDDAALLPDGLQSWFQPEDAEEIARYDDAGAYRPLKTAPNLRHGWRIELAGLAELRLALECFYPGRVGAFLMWRKQRLPVTPLRETLGRQTGMYRVTQKLTDEQAVALAERFCRSDGGCARTILWRVGGADGGPSLVGSLPAEKFDVECDQVLAGAGADPSEGPVAATHKSFPLLCQEACNLLVAEARAVVKGTKPAG